MSEYDDVIDHHAADRDAAEHGSVQTVGAAPPAGPVGSTRVDREFTGKERSATRMVVRRFFRHRLAAASLALFTILVLLAFVGAQFWKYHYNSDPSLDFNNSPSWAHPFGTDDQGYDEVALILRGTQQSIKIAAIIAIFSTTVGAIWGAISGFYKGIIDSVMMRIADVVLTLPLYVVAAVLGHNVGDGSWWLIGGVVAALLWAYVARVVRGSVLSLREKEYVEAARALGASDWRIIRTHLLPNTMGVIIVNATVLMATGILTETALSYLGFGVQPPDTSLGLLISNYQTAVFDRPWLFWIPGIFIILIALTVNFIGDGLRDAFDPQQNRVRA
jgi:ABC-type dipeptide/oligopeptide/nickel transport system permease subunit